MWSAGGSEEAEEDQEDRGVREVHDQLQHCEGEDGGGEAGEGQGEKEEAEYRGDGQESQA